MIDKFVPYPKFMEMTRKLQVKNISEKEQVTATVFVEKKEYAMVGSMSSGAKGWILVDGHRVIDLENYTGSLIPMSSWDHHEEVNQGRRERGYNGQMVSFGNRTLVLVGERIQFRPVQEGKQQELF